MVVQKPPPIGVHGTFDMFDLVTQSGRGEIEMLHFSGSISNAEPCCKIPCTQTVAGAGGGGRGRTSRRTALKSLIAQSVHVEVEEG